MSVKDSCYDGVITVQKQLSDAQDVPFLGIFVSPFKLALGGFECGLGFALSIRPLA